MINTRDRSITQNVAKMRFDQTLDFMAGVYFNIIQGLRCAGGYRRPVRSRKERGRIDARRGAISDLKMPRDRRESIVELTCIRNTLRTKTPVVYHKKICMAES